MNRLLLASMLLGLVSCFPLEVYTSNFCSETNSTTRDSLVGDYAVASFVASEKTFAKIEKVNNEYLLKLQITEPATEYSEGETFNFNASIQTCVLDGEEFLEAKTKEGFILFKLDSRQDDIALSLFMESFDYSIYEYEYEIPYTDELIDSEGNEYTLIDNGSVANPMDLLKARFKGYEASFVLVKK